MGKVLLLLLLLCASGGFCPKTAAQQLPAFKGLRYEEDYSFLQHDSTDHWYKNLKYSRFGKKQNHFRSLGGELRWQYQFYKNEEWGDLPPDNDGFLYLRNLVHADFHFGKQSRLFVQMKSNFMAGRPQPPRQIDENQLDLHQFFSDFSLGKWRARLGRQEFLFGAQRIVAVREGPNNRQTFDAARLTRQSGRFRADAFLARAVTDRPGIFDDGIVPPGASLWGLYTATNQVRFLNNAELYYLGFYTENAVFDDGRGRERRHSIGARIWGERGAWQYDGEALYQFGNFQDKKIRAYTASLHLRYTLTSVKNRPVLAVKTEIISGDRTHDDEALHTFNPLFPRGAYFGLAALIGPANLMDFHPSIEWPLGQNWLFGIDYDLFWRHSLHDGIYGPNVRPIYSGRNTSAYHIGNQLGVNLAWEPNRHLTIQAEATWFEAGAYLREVSAGKDVLFTAITAQWKY
ncbi:MAG: alginate export family protein [Thermoanaerobaculia bacterium]|nr:alginate export family protein [Thermoanaerobaculia bacterium]